MLHRENQTSPCFSCQGHSCGSVSSVFLRVIILPFLEDPGFNKKLQINSNISPIFEYQVLSLTLSDNFYFSNSGNFFGMEQILKDKVAEAIRHLYGKKIDKSQMQIQKTRKEFEGDYTIVVFPIAALSGKTPRETGKEMGEYLQENMNEVAKYNLVKGFLNLLFDKSYWLRRFQEINSAPDYGIKKPGKDSKTVLVEFSSPNTNKPLHLGHIRNNLIGYSLSNILKANGNKVVKVSIVNDRGIHICKSMIAYDNDKWSKNEKPSSKLKGDKLVGNYYVKFETKSKEQRNTIKNNWANVVIREDAGILKKYNKDQLSIYFKEITNKLVNKDFENEPVRVLKEIKSELQTKNIDGTIKDYIICRINCQIYSTLYINRAQKILQKWEMGDPSIRKLWEMMNDWVYEGFDQTYKRLGVEFDETDYESKTYEVGKKLVKEALNKGILEQKKDGSVWAYLTEDGLDEKLLLRADGTAVYMTQDLGTAVLRYKKHKFKEHIYVVGNEQNYHFQVLKLVLKKMGYPWADKLFHLSYGMVELPEGKMKSREGKVVDADDLIREMIDTAREMSKELGKLENYMEDQKEEIFRKIGLGALKYFILKVDPRKNMTFNPRESIDFNGNTGPFIQYTYARIQSVLRKACEGGTGIPEKFLPEFNPNQKEIEIVILLDRFPGIIVDAGESYNPALVANYCYELVKEYNQFYHDFPILKEEDVNTRDFRILLSKVTGKVIGKGMKLLGIEVPERM